MITEVIGNCHEQCARLIGWLTRPRTESDPVVIDWLLIPFIGLVSLLNMDDWLRDLCVGALWSPWLNTPSRFIPVFPFKLIRSIRGLKHRTTPNATPVDGGD